MLTVKLFLCSESASIDARVNTISAFHIMEQLNAPSFPVVVPRLSVIALLTREEQDASRVQLQLQIYSGETRLFDGPVPINFMQQSLTRTVMDMQGLVVPAPGTLRILLNDGATTIGSWTVIVNQIGAVGAQLIFPPVPPAAEIPR